MLTSIVAAFAGEAQQDLDIVAAFAMEAEQDLEPQALSLLQAQVQVVSAPEVDAQDDHAGAYSLADTLACASKEQVQSEMSVAFAKPATPGAVLSQQMQLVRLTPVAEAGDPPGADMFRAALMLMIIMIFVDGTRRWVLQKQDASSRKAAANTAEAAKEGAWVEMVNAASAGDVARFQKALNGSPRVSRTDTWGCTSLHFAAAGGSHAIATELLKRGLDVDALDANDETPLHFAARAGHAHICAVLLDAGAKVNAVNAQDVTPLVVAGQAKQESVCILLADRGAGVAGLADEDLPPMVVIQLMQKIFAAVASTAAS